MMGGTENRTGSYLHIEDVYKSYGGKLVLDNIDLSVQRGGEQRARQRQRFPHLPSLE